MNAADLPAMTIDVGCPVCGAKAGRNCKVLVGQASPSPFHLGRRLRLDEVRDVIAAALPDDPFDGLTA